MRGYKVAAPPSPHKVLGYPFGYRGGILEEGAERRLLKSETEQRFETVPTEIQGSDDTQGLSLRLWQLCDP